MNYMRECLTDDGSYDEASMHSAEDELGPGNVLPIGPKKSYSVRRRGTFAKKPTGRFKRNAASETPASEHHDVDHFPFPASATDGYRKPMDRVTQLRSVLAPVSDECRGHAVDQLQEIAENLGATALSD